jgi:hypothetical protein
LGTTASTSVLLVREKSRSSISWLLRHPRLQTERCWCWSWSSNCLLPRLQPCGNSWLLGCDALIHLLLPQ